MYYRITRRRAFATVVGALAAAGLVACGSNTGPGSGGGATDGTVGGTLTLGVSTEQERGLALFYEDFEEDSGATIDSTHMEVNALNEQLRIQVTSGTAPDIFRSAPGQSVPSAVLSLAGEGNVLDLADQPWVANIPPSFEPLMNVDDGVYAFPAAGQAIMMFYNKSVFEEVGVTPPTTWSEFIELCETLKAAGKIPVSLGLGTPAFVQFIPYELVSTLVANLEPDFIDDLAAGEATFSDSPGWRQAFEMFFGLIEDGYTTTDPLGVASDRSIQDVGTGDAAMIALTSANAPVLGDYTPNGMDDIGIFALPATDNPDDTWVPFSPDYFVVNANAENPATALAFLEYLADPARSAEYAAETGSLPALADAEPVDNPLNAAVQPFLDDTRTTPFANHLWPNGEVQQVLMAVSQEVVEGTSTIDDLLAAMDDAYAAGAS